MSKISIAFCFFILTFVSLDASSLDVCGAYKVKGVGAVSGESYSGTLDITQQEDVYVLQWIFNGDPVIYDFGTGVLNGDTLSVVFQELTPASFNGVQSYAIQEHGHLLSGPWSYFGGSTLGFETAKKKH